MSDSNLILEVKGLNKWFGATYANKNIDFQLRPGEVRGLAGENGSGKSTLLTQIAGIQPSDSLIQPPPVLLSAISPPASAGSSTEWPPRRLPSHTHPDWTPAA